MVLNYLKIVFNRLNEFVLYGNRRQNSLSEHNFRTEIIQNKKFSPIFFLSTGRTGTQLFAELLEHSKQTKVFHSPSALFCNAQSELIEQGKVSYEMYKKYGLDNEQTNDLVSQIFMASREDLLYKSYLHDKVYIETNNRITFLAPAIKKIFPHAKFVHLYRHPGEFIRSGIRRNYYIGDDNHQIGMIRPINTDSYFNLWKDMDSVEKVSWLWNETNSFIDDFFQTITRKDYIQFNFNNLTVEHINELMNFLNINDISEKTIKKAIDTPKNIQKSGSLKKYNKWIDEDKSKVKKICNNLSIKYGYKL